MSREIPDMQASRALKIGFVLGLWVNVGIFNMGLYLHGTSHMAITMSLVFPVLMTILYIGPLAIELAKSEVSNHAE